MVDHEHGDRLSINGHDAVVREVEGFMEYKCSRCGMWVGNPDLFNERGCPGVGG